MHQLAKSDGLRVDPKNVDPLDLLSSAIANEKQGRGEHKLIETVQYESSGFIDLFDDGCFLEVVHEYIGGNSDWVVYNDDSNCVLSYTPKGDDSGTGVFSFYCLDGCLGSGDSDVQEES